MDKGFPMQAAPDRNLLFGILALQLDFISQPQLVEGMQAWMLNKEKSLGDVFVAKGLVSTARKALLDSLVAEHVQQHNNDPEKSLAAVGLASSIKHQLDALGDPEISLAAACLRTSHPVSLAPRKSTRREPGPVAKSAHDASNGNPADLATMPHVARDEDLTPIRFSIVRPLAEGGLGIVSVAHDSELSREVALKEIKAAYADHLDSRSRFLKEAEITGRLEHPGIVPVYGLGTYPDGRPYYAMRMIKGESLKEAIDEFHAKDGKSRDKGRREIEQRELLRRFLDVCNAIEYAHSRGIVHRDLKPANIMLGKYGETLVVDWGLAKSVGETEQQTLADETVIVPELGTESVPTQIGEVVGTIAYMSPEQASGRQDAISPATDVYALGATLYNLLTGKLSQYGSDAGSLLRNIIQGKFPRPRDLKKGIPIPLEAICLKAMATKPNERYLSARALAADLEHYLADEPISAARESAVQRMQRWLRKHPKVTSALPIVILFSVLMALGLFGWKQSLQMKNDELEIANAKEEKARGLAEAARVQALEEKTNAETQRDHAQLVSKFVADLFRRPNAAVAGKSGKQVTAYEIIKDAREIMKDSFDDRPGVKRELLRLLSDTLMSLELHAEATPLLEEASTISLLSRDEDPIPYLDDLDRLATSLQNQGRFEEAVAMFKKELDLANELQARFARTPLEKSLTQISDKARNNLATCYQRAGDYPAAEKLLLDNIPRVEKSFPETDTAHAQQWQGLAALHLNMGDPMAALGDIEKAFQKLESAVSPEEEPHLKETIAFELASSKGTILRELRRLDESVQLLERTLAERQKTEGEDFPLTLNTMRNLARSLQEKGQLSVALPLYEKSYAGLKNSSAQPLFAKVVPDFAACLYELKRTKDALDKYQEALAVLQKIHGSLHPETAAARRDFSGLLCDLGELEAAHKLCDEALIVQRRLPTGHPALRSSLEQFSRIQIQEQDYERVLATVDEWEASLQAKGLSESQEAARALLFRVSALISLARMEEAQQVLSRLDAFVASVELDEATRRRMSFLRELVIQTGPNGKLASLQTPFMALRKADELSARSRWFAIEACDKLIEWIKRQGQPATTLEKAQKMRSEVLRQLRG